MVELTPIPKNDELQTSEDVVNNQKQKDLDKISQTKEFQQQSLLINTREVVADLKNQENKIYDKELQNELDAYILKKKKEELDYTAKKERNSIRQDVKAKVFKKKYDVAWQRYGYLYKSSWVDKLDEQGRACVDEKGNTIKVQKPAEDFTPNRFINFIREAVHFYKTLSDNAQKAIFVTIKWIIKLGALTGIGFLGWYAIKYLTSLGIFK